MPKEKRPIMIHFKATEEEMDRILERMKANEISNLSEYIRRMALTGYVLKLDLPEIRELIFLLRNMTNNLNQLTKRVNSGGTIYETELTELTENQKELWNLMNQILKLKALQLSTSLTRWTKFSVSAMKSPSCVTASTSAHGTARV